jgi:hypothetical protein
MTRFMVSVFISHFRSSSDYITGSETHKYANWKFRFEGVVEKVSSQARSVADDVGAGREGAHGIGMTAILYDDNCAALHCVGCDQNTGPANICVW